MEGRYGANQKLSFRAV